MIATDSIDKQHREIWSEQKLKSSELKQKRKEKRKRERKEWKKGTICIIQCLNDLVLVGASLKISISVVETDSNKLLFITMTEAIAWSNVSYIVFLKKVTNFFFFFFYFSVNIKEYDRRMRMLHETKQRNTCWKFSIHCTIQSICVCVYSKERKIRDWSSFETRTKSFQEKRLYLHARINASIDAIYRVARIKCWRAARSDVKEQWAANKTEKGRYAAEGGKKRKKKRNRNERNEEEYPRWRYWRRRRKKEKRKEMRQIRRRMVEKGTVNKCKYKLQNLESVRWGSHIHITMYICIYL